MIYFKNLAYYAASINNTLSISTSPVFLDKPGKVF